VPTLLVGYGIDLVVGFINNISITLQELFC
jgi:hypothetical protein